ncbi:hypothetical protein [Serinicoccus sp. CUA-874]|uniref:hypothetical protein n=1 Tax=Serinicoccus sp. CUA-874 TaxID=1517939 RepID=UPI001EDB1015|nr:hypothetical protein [Serinicoccus sp. CUA-874]
MSESGRPESGVQPEPEQRSQHADPSDTPADPVQFGQHPAPLRTLVHLSDTHLLADGTLQFGAIDTTTRLCTALERLTRLDPRPRRSSSPVTWPTRASQGHTGSCATSSTRSPRTSEPRSCG